MPGEQCGHVRGVVWKVKSVKGSTSSTIVSHANFGPGSSSCPTPGELATRAEAREYHHMLESMGDSMWRFVANL